jgi:type I site-specific restriction-modification system R (restriction) subunit
MTFYTKNDEGKFVEVVQDKLDDLFKERHNRWRETETEAIRAEVEKTVREELADSVAKEISKEIEDKVAAEFQQKLDKAESEIENLDIQIRQKTIAAEYGFKPSAEKYLGVGTHEEMRKEADNLKSNFAATTHSDMPEKSTGPGESEIQKRTGVIVKI